MPDFDTTLFVVVLSFFVANLVQGFTGFGVAIVAMAGLTLIGDVVHATILVNLTSGITILIILGRLWRHVSWPYLWPVIVGMVLGTPLGLALLLSFGRSQPDLVRRVLGVLIMAFAAYSLSGWAWQPGQASRKVGAIVGTIGGVLGGAFTMSGPALVAYVYSLPISRDAMKAGVNACFLFNCLYRLSLLVITGSISSGHLVAFGWSVPAVLAGVALGLYLARGLSTERFRRIAWWAFGFLGLLLVAR